MDQSQYDSQIKFWSTLIKRWGAQTNCLEFSVDLLSEALAFNTVYPPLRPAIDFLVKQKIIQPKDKYLRNSSLISSISSCLIGLFTTSPPCDIYIFSQNLKLKIQHLISVVESMSSSLTDVVLTKEEVKSKISDIPEDLLFTEIKRTKDIKSFEDGYYFKIKGIIVPNNDTIKTILHNKQTIHKIQIKIDELNTKISESIAKARELARKGKRDEAKKCLMYKASYERQETTLSQLYNQQLIIMHKFDQSEFNSRVASTYADSVSAMKQTKLPTHDEIDELNDDINDLIIAADENTNYILSRNDVDETELENELKQLMTLDQPLTSKSNNYTQKQSYKEQMLYT
ncbi:SNF7 family protein [Histomonas meleagridis]|uniref:SNF7 family protein n=1 Tax=Histomonas meleagridis TaxID=135588 RepID=UPI00355AA39B|nr:SNF7 family protein [Histomonas meleagridis]KAH0804175.1 SNF7 family protein [Histomonas meleagridis]